MGYVDTSALVKRYYEEWGTAVVGSLVERDDETVVITSLAVEELQFVCSDRELATAAEGGLATICPGLTEV